MWRRRKIRRFERTFRSWTLLEKSESDCGRAATMFVFCRAMTRFPLAWSVLLLSCGGGRRTELPVSQASEQVATLSSTSAAQSPPARTNDLITAAVSLPREAPRCPPEMALVVRPQGAFCIDRWEGALERRGAAGAREPWPSNEVVDGREEEMIAVSAPGRRPQGYVSGAQSQVACHNAGKRLCEVDEWVRACRGSGAHVYPYGDQRRGGACNDRDRVGEEHPVVALFERFAAPGENRAKMWAAEWMNDPRIFDLPHGVEPTGTRAECKSEYGVYDLVGNLHEWTADPEGTFVGGFFMDTQQNGEGCGYRTRAHKFSYHDYSTGFRCCRDADAR
jgi:formylglycine-generating enzyme